MENNLLDNIIYNKEWEKTLLYKISFGKLKPSKAWKSQLKRIKDNQKNISNKFLG
jgi:hypothetical protein